MKRLFSFFFLTLLFCLYSPTTYAGAFRITSYNEETGQGGSAPDLTIPRGYEITYPIYLANDDTIPHDYEMHVIDASTDAEGPHLKSVSDPQIEAGLWAQAPSLTHLEAGEGKVIDIIFKVPEEAALGKYFGAVVVQEAETSSSTTTAVEGTAVEDTAGITILTRSALTFNFTVVAPADYTGPIDISFWGQ